MTDNRKKSFRQIQNNTPKVDAFLKGRKEYRKPQITEDVAFSTYLGTCKTQFQSNCDEDPELTPG